MIKNPELEAARDLSNLEGIVFTFLTPRGKQEMGYAEYLADEELRGWVNDLSRYRLVLGRMIFSYDIDYLSCHPQTAQLIKDLEEEQKKNPLRFFAPSGKAALDFLNDFDSTLCIMTACNRFGKTQTMMIKKLINNIPCDPTWEIFTKYGVKWRPFRGGKELALATYDLPFHRSTSLPMLLNWIPEHELGVFSKRYKGKGAKQVNINNVPILPLTCGTNIHFTAMSQGQSPFEGNVKHDWGWDEQGSEAAFLGADARIVEVLDGRHDFALTPHKIDGRPDTGAGSWINKIYSKENTYGHKIGLYKGQVWDIPDWYFPEIKKEKEYYKWVTEPKDNQNLKRKREGDARFFGNWHESSGLVIDEWDSSVHMIDPFDIPDHWTRFRGVDHGDKHPAACVWCAISPAGDLFVYRDYLRVGKVPSQIAKEIVELSGNTMKKVGSYEDPRNSLVYSRNEEVQCGESFQWTVFDARAFSQKQNGVKLSKLYEMAGLRMKQGSGADSEHYVPILKEWFVVDPEKEHFVTGEKGAPRIYVFDTCTDVIKTIKRWVWAERKTKSSERLAKESPTKVDDDLMDALKLVIQANPRFVGNPRMGDKRFYDDMDTEWEEEKLITGRPLDASTGY